MTIAVKSHDAVRFKSNLLSWRNFQNSISLQGWAHPHHTHKTNILKCKILHINYYFSSGIYPHWQFECWGSKFICDLGNSSWENNHHKVHSVAVLWILMISNFISRWSFPSCHGIVFSEPFSICWWRWDMIELSKGFGFIFPAHDLCCHTDSMKVIEVLVMVLTGWKLNHIKNGGKNTSDIVSLLLKIIHRPQREQFSETKFCWRNRPSWELFWVLCELSRITVIALFVRRYVPVEFLRINVQCCEHKNNNAFSIILDWWQKSQNLDKPPWQDTTRESGRGASSKLPEVLATLKTTSLIGYWSLCLVAWRLLFLSLASSGERAVLDEQVVNEVVRTVIDRSRRSFLHSDLRLGQTCDQAGREIRGLWWRGGYEVSGWSAARSWESEADGGNIQETRDLELTTELDQ